MNDTCKETHQERLSTNHHVFFVRVNRGKEYAFLFLASWEDTRLEKKKILKEIVFCLLNSLSTSLVPGLVSAFLRAFSFSFSRETALSLCYI